MGVLARLLLYARDEQTADQAADAAFHTVELLEQISSDYRPASEAMRLCAKAGGDPVKVSPELYTLLERSCEMARISDGAFDPTIGPMVALWRKARKTGQFPTPDEIEAARRLVGWQKIKLDPKQRTAQLLVPGMKLDFGGIAKGYAGDLAIATLKQYGISSALFEIGGDIVVSDAPADAPGWIIEVIPESPTATPRRVTLTNAAISTSGDTEQFVEFNGRRYSHIIDPRTGVGLTDRVLATVIAKDGITSDALSTTASVMGEKGIAILTKAFPGVQITIRHATD